MKVNEVVECHNGRKISKKLRVGNRHNFFLKMFKFFIFDLKYQKSAPKNFFQFLSSG